MQLQNGSLIKYRIKIYKQELGPMKKQDQSQQSVDNKDDNIEEHFKVPYESFPLLDFLN